MWSHNQCAGSDLWCGNNDKPFYKTTTSLNTLALLYPLIEGEGQERGPNSADGIRIR